MLEPHQMPTSHPEAGALPLITAQAFAAVVNLRADASNPEFVRAFKDALHIDLPTTPCSTAIASNLRVVWVGPDEWFILASAGEQERISTDLSMALTGHVCAITDVSSGYFLVSLSGAQARSVLQQGCPLDLHPRAFRTGKAAGSHFFKVGIYLWTRDDATFELLVRRSFIDHFWQLISRCTRSCGWDSTCAA